MQKGDYDKALADFEAAWKLDPKNGLHHCNVGSIWQVRGDYEQALHHANLGIALEPKRALLYYYRGDIWRDKGDYAMAISDFTEAQKTRSEKT